MLMSALREEGDKITDSDALLAVYQASYLAFPGDTVLDQARAFAVGKLAGRDDDSDCTHLIAVAVAVTMDSSEATGHVVAQGRRP